MSKLIRLTLGIFFITIPLYGQEITKEDIIKFKIKSITTIDGDELVKSIDYYNNSGDIIKISDKDNDEIKTRKEFIYNNDRLLIEEKTYNTDGEVHHISKYIYNHYCPTKNKPWAQETIAQQWIPMVFTIFQIWG